MKGRRPNRPTKSAADARGPKRGARPERAARPARSRPDRGEPARSKSARPAPERSGPAATGPARSGPQRSRTARKDRPQDAEPTRSRHVRKAHAPEPERARPASHPVARPEPPAAPDPALQQVQHVTVTPDEDGMRIDRYLETRVPGLAFARLQRIIRKGELRVGGKRVKASDRVKTGDLLRIPPMRDGEPSQRPRSSEKDGDTRAFLESITLYEDDDVMVLDKPMGLAVQGGHGTPHHVDQMLEALPQPNGQRARLVHRLDKDTSGCLLIAKTRFAAAELARTFRSRSARKVYWALVAGVPKLRQGRLSTYLAKDTEAEARGEAKMRIARHGEDGASHAITYYAVVETAARIASWVSLKPVTGRTHQLRAHMAELGNPIIGDAKYFARNDWELPPGMQNKLHLLARRIRVPHPRTGKPIDVTAPLPPHMRQSWSLLAFDTDRYDPIEDAPEE